MKQHITDYPFEQLMNPATEQARFQEFIRDNEIEHNSAFFPHMLAYIAEAYKIPERDAGGKIDALQYLKINDTPKHRGIWRLLSTTNRSSFFRVGKPQTHPDVLPYCSLVPLHMAAHKKFDNIKYSSWTNVEHLVGPKLWELMDSYFPSMPKDEVLQLRVLGLGGRSPMTFNRVYKLADTELRKLTGFANPVFFQIWCAHPNLRNEYMILDPADWDNMPEPLVEDEIFTVPIKEPKIKKMTNIEVPWL